ncbi:hypothetical protein CO178_02335 [candidate division WWE3 bacterium CG_4_9_14_3_um_filter_34_6]|uniref:Transposase IS200-like domain-containing protein n=1 Tax=candidate division WWE3 bacterium CG_4_9_14_3_um_filter_34_6 TaxID=1975079 RepID=A0A2M7X2H3_UNCKA|nr:MAG: hypothetical protein CO178_02335 [candidate division WWE3 bacterium CG_4_9_14_3_um_filter_34_6]
MIFIDNKDYVMFMYLLKKYLEPGFKLNQRHLIARESNHLYQEVSLFAFCLMPNHFHLLLKQSSKYGMTKLLSRISSSYTRYFNEKYKKNGQLWEGTYKAVAIETERQFNKVISYIHENPIELGANIEEYNFSSYPAYLGKRKYKWLNRGSPGTGATPSSG